MLARVAMPAVRQKRSKLAPTSCQASSTIATGTTAADVVDSFMALLLLRGFSTPSLLAQGEQRLPSYFNIRRDIPGRPSYPLLTYVKLLLLQQWYGLSDPGLEEAVDDRLSF